MTDIICYIASLGGNHVADSDVSHSLHCIVHTYLHTYHGKPVIKIVHENRQVSTRSLIQLISSWRVQDTVFN